MRRIHNLFFIVFKIRLFFHHLVNPIWTNYPRIYIPHDFTLTLSPSPIKGEGKWKGRLFHSRSDNLGKVEYLHAVDFKLFEPFLKLHYTAGAVGNDNIRLCFHQFLDTVDGKYLA